MYTPSTVPYNITCSSFCVVLVQLIDLVSEKSELLKLWEDRKAEFDQCMDLQLFMRDADQLDAWMAKQEVCVCVCVCVHARVCMHVCAIFRILNFMIP